MVTLTCNVTGGITQRWLYNTMPIGNSIIAVDVSPMTDRVDGVNFTLLLLSTMNSPYLASQISFVATERMDGRIVECRTAFPRMSNATVVSDTTTLRVGSGSECRHRARGRGKGHPHSENMFIYSLAHYETVFSHILGLPTSTYRQVLLCRVVV
jgi:hypothetical protein